MLPRSIIELTSGTKPSNFHNQNMNVLQISTIDTNLREELAAGSRCESSYFRITNVVSSRNHDHVAFELGDASENTSNHVLWGDVFGDPPRSAIPKTDSADPSRRGSKPCSKRAKPNASSPPPPAAPIPPPATTSAPPANPQVIIPNYPRPGLVSTHHAATSSTTRPPNQGFTRANYPRAGFPSTMFARRPATSNPRTINPNLVTPLRPQRGSMDATPSGLSTTAIAAPNNYNVMGTVRAPGFNVSNYGNRGINMVGSSANNQNMMGSMYAAANNYNVIATANQGGDTSFHDQSNTCMLDIAVEGTNLQQQQRRQQYGLFSNNYSANYQQNQGPISPNMGRPPQNVDATTLFNNGVAITQESYSYLGGMNASSVENESLHQEYGRLQPRDFDDQQARVNDNQSWFRDNQGRMNPDQARNSEDMNQARTSGKAALHGNSYLQMLSSDCHEKGTHEGNESEINQIPTQKQGVEGTFRNPTGNNYDDSVLNDHYIGAILKQMGDRLINMGGNIDGSDSAYTGSNEVAINDKNFPSDEEMAEVYLGVSAVDDNLSVRDFENFATELRRPLPSEQTNVSEDFSSVLENFDKWEDSSATDPTELPLPSEQTNVSEDVLSVLENFDKWENSSSRDDSIKSSTLSSADFNVFDMDLKELPACDVESDLLKDLNEMPNLLPKDWNPEHDSQPLIDVISGTNQAAETITNIVDETEASVQADSNMQDNDN